MDLHAWCDAARQFLVPELSGQWRVVMPNLIYEDVGWTVRILSPEPSDHLPGFYLEAFVQLLAVPRGHPVVDNGLRVGHAAMGGYWDAAPTAAGYEPTMRQIAALVRAEAIPHFERHGTVDGHLAHLRERMTRLADRGGAWIDPNLDEELVYINLIRGDLAGADEAARMADRALESMRSGGVPPVWAERVHKRVTTTIAAARRDPGKALDMLRDNARRTARRLRLPRPDL